MHKRNFFIALLLAVFSVTALGSCATQSARDDDGIVASIAIPNANSLAGGYLAGRHAQRHQDWDAAQNYLGTVSAIDAENDLMLQRAFLLAVGAQNYDGAHALATDVLARGLTSDIALVYLAADNMRNGKYADALTYIDQLPEDGFGDFSKPLLKAWVLTALGRGEQVQEEMARLETSDPALHFHAGLLAEMRGADEEAMAHYRIVMEEGLTLPSAVHIAGFFKQRQAPEISNKIYEGLGQLYPFNPFSNANNPELVDGHKPITALQGASLVLLDIATLLYERRAYDSAQIYGGMVLMLDPASDFSKMMMGDIAALYERYQKSVDFYNGIEATSPLYWLSRMRVAEVYEMKGDTDKATRLLAQLAQSPELKTHALVSLGDIYRRKEDFANAVRVYDAALQGIDELTEEHWPIIYARGMSLERMNNWDRAEQDLLKALSFQPENPMILNYIGYSWADKGLNLDRALSFIRKAVELRPQDGYILDSYGWALYQNGQYDEAVMWLEKAVEQVPGDSTILDHLGDAYWKTGRHTEAGFQWGHARNLSSDDVFRAMINAKIKDGIPDQVMSKHARKEAKL